MGSNFRMTKSWDLNTWQLLASICQKGSLTAACIEQNVDIATASRKIIALEKEIGVDLLDRNKKPVAPSFFLRTQLPNIQKASRVIEKIILAARQENTRMKKIRISSWAGGLVHNLIALKDDYNKFFPEIGIEILGRCPLKALEQGDVDAILTPVDSKSEDVVSYDIGKCFNFPVASPSYLKTHGRPRSPLDLEGHRVLLFRIEEYPVADCLYNKNSIFDLESGEMLSIQPDGKLKTTDRINSNSFERCYFSDISVLLGAMDGQGIVVDLPLSLVSSYLESGLLEPVFPQWHREAWNRKIYVRKGEVREEVISFVQWLCNREKMEARQRWTQVYARHRVPLPL